MFELPLALALLLSLVLALLLTGIQYSFAKNHRNLFLPAFLRFLSWLFLFLLLFNPKLKKNTQQIIKPQLVVLADNSASVEYLQTAENAKDFLSLLKSNTELNTHFEVKTYTFGSDVSLSDSLTFTEPASDFSKAFSLIKQLHKRRNYPLVLISDGRQSAGNDYLYAFENSPSTQVYPVILGDTFRYADLAIQRINVNKSVFLGNEYSLEVFLTYEGDEKVNSRFSVIDGGQTVHFENISFDAQQQTAVKNIKLKATPVGIKTLTLQLNPLDNEKNTTNNVHKTSIRVIDQQARILLVSDFPHPDVGMWKRAIESSPFRKVEVASPKNTAEITPYQLIIRFQPSVAFEPIDRQIAQLKKNTLTVIGTKTQTEYINQNTKAFSIKEVSFAENIQAAFRAEFSPFYVKDLGFESFPPLKGHFAEYIFNTQTEVLLSQRINNVALQKPLFFTYEDGETRYAVITAENLWQWRSASFLRENQSYAPFDNFISSVIMYLSTGRNTDRLLLEYEPFQENFADRIIIARWFDRTMTPDVRGDFSISLTRREDGYQTSLPMILTGNYYQADVSRLPPGNYDFTVTENTEKMSKSGEIIIPDYQPEQQYLTPDTDKLKNLAQRTNGKIFLPNQARDLFQQLLENPDYKPILKAQITEDSLIQQKWLVLFILLTTGAEWILRKYKGLL